MRVHVSILSAALAISALLSSCKKGDDTSNNGGSNGGGTDNFAKQLEGVWRIESQTRYVADANGTLTPKDILNDCEKDDTYTFTGNFYTGNGGAVPCPYTKGYNTQFQWTLYKDSTFHFNFGPGFNTASKLDFINATTMQLSARFSGTLDREVFVYKRK